MLSEALINSVIPPIIGDVMVSTGMDGMWTASRGVISPLVR